jgi:hypothetical protein
MQAWDDGACSGVNGYLPQHGEEKTVCDYWADYVASSKDAKKTWLHCIHVNGYGDAIVDEGSHVNQVAGFSEKVFGMLAQTEGLVAGDEEEAVALPTMDQIRKGWVVKPSLEG